MIEGSSSSSGQRDLFMGYEKFKVLAFSPQTKEEISAINEQYGTSFREPDEDPVYVDTDQEDNKRVRIDVYFSNAPENENTPHISFVKAFFISNAMVKSGSGKTQYVNRFGESAYLEDVENIPSNMSWLKTDGIRAARNGEVTVTEFVKNFANVKRGSACQLDVKELLAGNFSQLSALVDTENPDNTIAHNRVGVLLTVRVLEKEKEGEKITMHVQDCFTRKFERGWSKSLDYLKKEVESYLANASSNSSLFPDYPYKLEKWSKEAAKEESSDAPKESFDSTEDDDPFKD